jgi:flavin reductase (DIM6/NTAB) family NADH-FMN oxidoreductase RutF
MPRTLEPQDALRLLNGGPVALVTTRWRDETDVMPAVWITQLSRTPPLVGLAVNPSRHTHDMIRFSEQFALNYPARDMVNQTHYFGAVSGKDVDKLELAKLGTFRASKVDAPLIQGCVAWVECGVEDSFRFGDHTLFIGRVLVVQVEPEAFDETWTLGDPDYRPLHYLGVDQYATLGQRLTARLRTSHEGAIDFAEQPDERERRQEEEAREKERQQGEGEEA